MCVCVPLYASFPYVLSSLENKFIHEKYRHIFIKETQQRMNRVLINKQISQFPLQNNNLFIYY